MTKRNNALLALGLLLNAAVCNAASTGGRSIERVGCHLENKVCYVTISGNAVGPSGCVGNSVRWNEDAANGKATLSLLTAAMMAGKNVDIEISSECFINQPNFPTLKWMAISGVPNE